MKKGVYRGIHGDQLGSIGFKGDQWVQWVSKGTHKDPKGSIGICQDPYDSSAAVGSSFVDHPARRK